MKPIKKNSGQISEQNQRKNAEKKTLKIIFCFINILFYYHHFIIFYFIYIKTLRMIYRNNIV